MNNEFCVVEMRSGYVIFFDQFNLIRRSVLTSGGSSPLPIAIARSNRGSPYQVEICYFERVIFVPQQNPQLNSTPQ
jgi:hypothetical protein